MLGMGHALDVLAPTHEAIARARCRAGRGRYYPRPPRSKPHKHLASKAVATAPSAGGLFAKPLSGGDKLKRVGLLLVFESRLFF